MCGITGFVARPGTQGIPELLRSMCDLIAQRGPDDEGFGHYGAVHMGMRRLAIIDPEGGKQPVATPDANYALTFNGEIYNYRELRAELISKGCTFVTDSDSEVLLWGLVP